MGSRRLAPSLSGTLCWAHRWAGPTVLVLVISVLVMSASLWGCGSEVGPTEPEGGYLAFRDALLSGHPEQLWEWIDADTRQVYEDGVGELRALAESIRLLSPADRALAYERTAVSLADQVNTGAELFNRVVRLENLVGDERYRLGTEMDEIETEEDQATVTTRAGQTFEMVREDDGIWRVSSLIEEAREQLHPIAEAVTAVDVIAAESAYMRRTHEEIVLLLGGEVTEDDQDGTRPESEGTGDGTGGSATP